MVQEVRQPSFFEGSPSENFSKGLLEVTLPSEFGPRTQGKVRDIWIRDGVRIMVTTDRQSAYDRMICTIPGKGEALNMTSAWWFEKTEGLAPNHLIAVPHPNVLIAKQAAATIPVEVVWRAYMAKSYSSTSVYFNYAERGRRNICGINFPDGLCANEQFPKPVLAPTTKADSGHDEELDDDAASDIADKVGGRGTWRKIKTMTESLFAYGSHVLRQKGLILVDTKYEIGIDQDGHLMVIDEQHTPDSSRIWLASSYQEQFEKGENPETYDKEILRRWLAEHDFRGEGMVPIIPDGVIDQMASAYEVPYYALTGQHFSASTSGSQEIQNAILQYLNQSSSSDFGHWRL